MPGGFCKPCFRARSCRECGRVNEDPNAKICFCSDRRMRLGARQNMLALWCPAHTTEAERASGQCRECFDNMPQHCEHCQTKHDLTDCAHACSDPDCHRKMRFCARCSSVFARASRVQCKKCWYGAGEICIFCQTQRARNHLRFFRHCQQCARGVFCKICATPPPAQLQARACRMCPALSLWCEQHCTAIEIRSNLCRTHFDSYHERCEFCPQAAATTPISLGQSAPSSLGVFSEPPNPLSKQYSLQCPSELLSSGVISDPPNPHYEDHTFQNQSEKPAVDGAPLIHEKAGGRTP